MCGRFGLFGEHNDVAMLFDTSTLTVPSFPDSYNIAPGRRILAYAQDATFKTPTWGVPTQTGQRPISNARSETAHQKPTFKHGYNHNRCLIPARGFYEWQPTAEGKQPVWIHHEDGQLFAFAGLITQRDQAAVILTTQPNKLVQPIHNRMPVILQPDEFQDWLDPQNSHPQLSHLTRCRPWNGFITCQVSRKVNQDNADGAQLISPLR